MTSEDLGRMLGLCEDFTCGCEPRHTPLEMDAIRDARRRGVDAGRPYEALRLRSGQIIMRDAHMPTGKCMSVPVMDGLVRLVRPGVYRAAENQGAKKVLVWGMASPRPRPLSQSDNRLLKMINRDARWSVPK